MLYLSTAYFPPVIYMASLLRSESCFIEKEETYPKQTYRNRCSIYTANGKLNLSIPVKKPQGNHTKTKDVRIANEDNWSIRHWRAIESAYNASPFFLFYQDELKDLLLHPAGNLLMHNDRILQSLLKLLNIRPDYKYTETFLKTPEKAVDLRNEISPKKKLVTKLPEYPQVFSEKFGFIQNLSVLDLLFNLGPESIDYLKEIAETELYFA